MLNKLFMAAALVLALPIGTALSGEMADAAYDSCTTATNMPEPICTCIAEGVETELNDNEQAFFVAMISGGDASSVPGITGEEMTNVATFMRDKPAACAEGMMPE